MSKKIIVNSVLRLYISYLNILIVRLFNKIAVNSIYNNGDFIEIFA